MSLIKEGFPTKDKRSIPTTCTYSNALIAKKKCSNLRTQTLPTHASCSTELAIEVSTETRKIASNLIMFFLKFALLKNFKLRPFKHVTIIANFYCQLSKLRCNHSFFETHWVRMSQLTRY